MNYLDPSEYEMYGLEETTLESLGDGGVGADGRALPSRNTGVGPVHGTDATGRAGNRAVNVPAAGGKCARVLSAGGGEGALWSAAPWRPGSRDLASMLRMHLG